MMSAVVYFTCVILVNELITINTYSQQNNFIFPCHFKSKQYKVLARILNVSKL